MAKLRLLLSLILPLVIVAPLWAAQSPQVPLAARNVPQFAQPLPTLALPGTDGTIAVADGTNALTIRMCEFDAKVLPPGTFAPGQQPTTRVWGYVAGSTCPTSPQDTYLGPVVLAKRGVATRMTFVNALGTTDTTGVLAYKYSTDQTLHWADPLNDEENECNMMGGVPAFGSDCAQNYSGPIPATVHLHGGEVPPALDGGPDSWYTSDGSHQGHGYYSYPGGHANQATYIYPNTQEAAPLWFHDHTLGATRLNVYAGLAGAYLLRDESRTQPAGLDHYGLVNQGIFEPTVPVIIQDRSFDTNGQFMMPADSSGGVLSAPNPDHPYWVPEFVGDTILVNGKAWPYFNVEPKRYRFLFLNGSNARTYEMFLTDQVTKVMGPPMYVIGTDGGYLDAPAKIDPNAPKRQAQKLVMMPGERYEVIIDFAGLAPGTNLLLRNVAKTPYPGGETPPGTSLGQIMQFRVGACTSNCGNDDTSYDPTGGAALRSGSQAIQRLASGQKTRQLTLNEVMGMPVTAIDPATGATLAYPGGPLQILLNNTGWAGDPTRTDFTPVTVDGSTSYVSELPREGDTEIWDIVNLTADAHPIHLHLTQFQILSRQNFNANKYLPVYNAEFPGGVYLPEYGPPNDYRSANNPLSGGKDGGNPDITPYLQGQSQPGLSYEAGWKDTAVMYPGQVTRIAVRWAPTDVATGAPRSDLYYPFDPNDGNRGYVWHCHIIDHEDNEMMRPDAVQLNDAAPGPAARPLQKGQDY